MEEIVNISSSPETASESTQLQKPITVQVYEKSDIAPAVLGSSRWKMDDLLVNSGVVPNTRSHKAKLHAAETVLGDALPRPRLPKSLRQLYGNSMDAESRRMPFFHRVHEVDSFLTSLQFPE